MLRTLFHLALLPFVARYQRATDDRCSPALLAFLWYLAGLPLMMVESRIVDGSFWGGAFLQGAACAAFFLPAVWSFFRLRVRRRNPILPVLTLAALLAAGGLAAAAAFARLQALGNLAA